MEDGTTNKQLSVAKEEILAIENVKDATLFTKEDTLEYMKTIFDEKSAALEGYEGENNPFRDSYKITLNDLYLAEETTKALSEIENVSEVSNNREVLNSILKTSGTIRTGSLVIMIMLCLISVFIIANTIKIAVFSRRKEIGVMKFVGATNWFIRWPFIFEGIITGVVGALISFALISWAYVVVYSKTLTLNMDVFSLMPYSSLWSILLICFISIGTLIGAVGSALSIRKHLDV
jgi:cell division transport system permease protein